MENTFKKNDIVEVYIEDMSETGEGIGHVNGLTLFVKNGVIGDTVKAGITKVKKTYCYARCVEIINPSEFRTEPNCPVYSPCGGCQLQALSYEKQIDFKTKKVADCLKRLGGFKVVIRGSEDYHRLAGVKQNNTIENALEKEDTYEDNLGDYIVIERALGMDNPWNYRNKAQFPVGLSKEGKPVAGFYAGRSHSVIPTSYCAIEFEGHEVILEAVMNYINEAGESIYNEETGKGLIRHILMRKGFATGEIMVVLVINGKKLKNEALFVDKLSKLEGIASIQLNFNNKQTNVILGDECRTLYGKDYITDKIGDVSYQISALSFYQVNPAQTKVLYEKALEFAGLTGNEVVWDLYCGIGTISLFLAQAAKQVYGVEIIPQAVENAKNNAKLNNMNNAEFFVGAAEDVYVEKKLPADVIVVDPPRKGLEENLVDTISQMGPDRIVYVSCDPATLARDCKRFGENGYKILKVQPVDMFPQGVHVETVCLLTRKP